jgi:hypothetical protein
MLNVFKVEIADVSVAILYPYPTPSRLAILNQIDLIRQAGFKLYER